MGDRSADVQNALQRNENPQLTSYV